MQPGESRIGSELCVHEHWEIGVKHCGLIRETSERSRTGRPVRGIQNQLARTKLAYHNLQISDNQNLEKIFTNVRQKLIVRRDAEIDLEPEPRDQARHHDWMAIYSLDEIHFAAWQSNQVGESRGTRLVRLSSLSEHSEAKEKWKDQLHFPTVQRIQRIIWNRRRTDWVRVEYFPWHTTLQILQEIQVRMAVRQTRPEEFEDRIILLSVFNDIDWTRKGSCNECFLNSEKVRYFEKDFSWDFGLFSVLVKKKVVWDAQPQTRRIVEFNCRCHGCQFPRQWTPILQRSQCIGSRTLEKRKGGRCTIHFSAKPSNAVLLFGTVDSANQRSMYGEIEDWCDELTQVTPGQSFSSMEKSVAKVNEQSSRKLEPEEVNTLVRTPETNVQAAERFAKVIKWDKAISDLWTCWIHEESLYWTILPNHSQRGWWFWRKDRAMQRVYVTSWSPRYCSYWVVK